MSTTQNANNPFRANVERLVRAAEPTCADLVAIDTDGFALYRLSDEPGLFRRALSMKEGEAVSLVGEREEVSQDADLATGYDVALAKLRASGRATPLPPVAKLTG